MMKQSSASREDPFSNSGLPIDIAEWGIDLADDYVDHAVEQLLFIPHVLVERHWYDAELLGDLAHARRLDTPLIGEVNGSAQDAIPAQLVTLMNIRCGLRPQADPLHAGCRLTRCTPYT